MAMGFKNFASFAKLCNKWYLSYICTDIKSYTKENFINFIKDNPAISTDLEAFWLDTNFRRIFDNDQSRFHEFLKMHNQVFGLEGEENFHHFEQIKKVLTDLADVSVQEMIPEKFKKAWARVDVKFLFQTRYNFAAFCCLFTHDYEDLSKSQRIAEFDVIIKSVRWIFFIFWSIRWSIS